MDGFIGDDRVMAGEVLRGLKGEAVEDFKLGSN